jgi:hypothetical protein
VQYVEVAGGVGVGALVVLHGNHPDNPVANAQRRGQHHLRHQAIGRDGAFAHQALEVVVGQVARLPAFDDVLRHPRRKRPRRLRAVLGVLVHVVHELQLGTGLIAKGNEEVAGFDNLAQLAVDGPIEAGQVLGANGQVGDAVVDFLEPLGLDAVGDVVQDGAAAHRLALLPHHAHAANQVDGLAGAGQEHGFDLVHRLAVVEVTQLVEQLGLVVRVHNVGQGAAGQLLIAVAQLLLPGFVHEQKAVVGAQVLHQILCVVEEVLQVGAVAGQRLRGQVAARWLVARRPHPDDGAGNVAHEVGPPLHDAQVALTGGQGPLVAGGHLLAGNAFEVALQAHAPLVRRHKQLLVGLAHHLRVGVAGELQEQLIYFDDVPLAVGQHISLAQLVEQRGQGWSSRDRNRINGGRSHSTDKEILQKHPRGRGGGCKFDEK